MRGKEGERKKERRTEAAKEDKGDDQRCDSWQSELTQIHRSQSNHINRDSHLPTPTRRAVFAQIISFRSSHGCMCETEFCDCPLDTAK